MLALPLRCAFLLLLAAPALRADTYHLISPTAAGVSVNPGQSLSTASTANSGFTPTRSITGTPSYWYAPAISGSFAAGTWQLVVWSSAPGCTANVTAEIGYSNPDGSGYVSLGSQTLDFNLPGNHPNAFSFSVPFQNLVSKSLRVTLTLAGGCAPTMAYNAGVDFDSRLITPVFGPNGTPTMSPSFTPSPSASPTPVPPLVKSVNAASAFVGQTLTYTLNYENPNPATPDSCGDDFENAGTDWPAGWAPPTGGIWTRTTDNGPSGAGSQALDAQSTGGFHFTTINCGQQVTDGQLQVDAKIMTANGEISLLWRQGGSSTYQMHLVQGSSANASLRVITNGAFNEIAVASTPINLGQWYTLRLVVTGFTLSAYVNGVLLMSATDPNTTYSAGAVGLEIDDAPATGMHARFDNVQITKYQLDWYGVSIIDTLPAGLTYASSSCAASVAGQVVTIPLGTLAAGTQASCRILAVVNACPATLQNRADLHVSLPAMSFRSNQVSTTVSCSTPTFTPTRSPTPSATRTRTPSATPTASPTATPSASPTATPTASPSATASATATPTATRSATPSTSPSSTATLTRTPTATATATRTETATRTATLSSTPTASPTLSWTVTDSPTQTATATASPTRSDTPTATSSITIGPSPTDTATPTATPSPSATRSITPTRSPSPSATSSPTASPSATASATRTGSPTATLTLTITLTSTDTPSATLSPSVTDSPTISPTPVPLPFQVVVGVYNQAGERVRLLFDGANAVLPGGYQLSAGTLVPGQGTVLILGASGEALGLPGFNGSNDQGQWLSNGVYYVKVESRDSFGASSASILPVQLLSAPSTRITALEVFNSAGERVALLPLSGPAESGSLSLLQSVLVPGRSPLKLQGRDALGALQTTQWDGLDARGAAVRSGTYYLKATDGAAGMADYQWTFSVLAAPAEAVSAPRIAPNPVPAGASQLRIQAPGGGAPWSVALFDLSGARVAEQGLGAGQDAALDIASLSGGVYLAQVRTRDLRGQELRWILKAALLR